MSWAILAKRIGVKFQKVQKYGTEANGISASRPWEKSQSVGGFVSFFFKDSNTLSAENHSVFERSSKGMRFMAGSMAVYAKSTLTERDEAQILGSAYERLPLFPGVK